MYNSEHKQESSQQNLTRAVKLPLKKNNFSKV